MNGFLFPASNALSLPSSASNYENTMMMPYTPHTRLPSALQGGQADATLSAFARGIVGHLDAGRRSVGNVRTLNRPLVPGRTVPLG